ncbi:MAG: hypothetical protein ACJ76F_13560 [Bacteroidia bacterium]
MQKEETELDFKDDVDFTTRADKFKNTGIVLLTLVVLSGLSGLLGFGIWTKTKEGNASFSFQYEKFMRAKRETRMKAFVANPTDSLVRIFISGSYFEKAHIDKIIPSPMKMTSAEGGITFTFEAKGPLEIVFLVMAEKMGKQHALVKSGSTEFSINQFIYP